MRMWWKRDQMEEKKYKILFVSLAGWIILLVLLYLVVPIFLYRCTLVRVLPGQLAGDAESPVFIVEGSGIRGAIYVNGYEVPEESYLTFQTEYAAFRADAEWLNQDTIEIWHADKIPFLARSNTLQVEVNSENAPAVELSDDYTEFYENGVDARANAAAYLNELKKSPYRIYIAIRDEGIGALDEELINSLRELGVQTDLAGKYRHSYIGVLEGRESLFEADAEYEPVIYEDEYAAAASAGLYAGDFAFINIGGREAAVGGRGLNIVVFDKEENRIVESAVIDTCYGLSMTRLQPL